VILGNFNCGQQVEGSNILAFRRMLQD